MEDISPGTWDVHLHRRTITHRSGLVVYLEQDDADPKGWSVRNSNALEWVKGDFPIRAGKILIMLRAAVAAFALAKLKNKT